MNEEFIFLILPDYEIIESHKLQMTDLYLSCFYPDMDFTHHQKLYVKELLCDNNTYLWFLIKNEDIVVGMVSLVLIYENSHKYSIKPDLGENILNLCVSKNFRKRGLARILMEKVCSHSKNYINSDLVLEIEKTSLYTKQLLHLYKSMGFIDLIDTETGHFFIRK